MQIQLLSATASPMPPCCDDCQSLMSFKGTQSWTLLRGEQLGRFTFECIECGATSTWIAEQRDLTKLAA
jgi:hypothetical protein